MNSPNLDQLHVSTLNGVGTQISSKLSKIGIYTIQDLLFHLPLRYIDRTQISPIGTLKADQEVAIEGEIIGSEVIYGRRRSLLCRLEDITGAINLRFFHFVNIFQKSDVIYDLVWEVGSVGKRTKVLSNFNDIKCK